MIDCENCSFKKFSEDVADKLAEVLIDKDCMDEDAKQASIPYTDNALKKAYLNSDYIRGCDAGILNAAIRPKGKWIGDSYNPECDQCHTKPLEEFCDSLGLDGGSYVSIPMFFCPNCGADMRGDTE